jgi:hypothetical protein
MTRKQPPPRRRFVQHEADFDIIVAMDTLFRRWFEGPSWDPWRTILKAAFALPMTKQEIAFFKSIAGDRDPPPRRVKELFVVGGRRGGKDSVVSLVACFVSVFFQASLAQLRPGEKATVSCVACDRDQSRIILNYVRSYFDLIPPLRNMVTRRTASGLELENDVSIEVATNSFRAVRGRSFLLSVLDECAFYADENSASPDTELYNAIKPGLATLPGAMLIGISTPHRKSGLLFSKWKKHFGENDDNVLVIQASTETLNPTIDREFVQQFYDADPQVAAAEWGAQWRDDISGFVDPEVVAACVRGGIKELPPMTQTRYFGFVDPSGGSSDSMTSAVAHREGEQVIIDCLRERRPPFNPTDVVMEHAAMFRSYGIANAQSDKYAGSWVTEAFAPYGVRIEQTARAKNDLYIDLLPLLNAGRIELLDIPRLVSQLCSLERTTVRGARDKIDHPRNGHDDLSNAVAGVSALAIQNQGVTVSPELLRRVMQMPINPRRSNSANRFVKRAGLATLINAMVPREKQVMPASSLPREKFEVRSQPTKFGRQKNEVMGSNGGHRSESGFPDIEMHRKHGG